MALYITDECIVCGRCEKTCPTESISLGEEIFVINDKTCNECEGIIGGSQCAAVCPVECCVQIETKKSTSV